MLNPLIASLLTGLSLVAAGGSTQDVWEQVDRNAMQWAEAMQRCDAYLDGWLAHADPETGLIPRNLTRDRDVWNAQDAAADNFAFMILTTVFGGRKEKKRRAALLGSLAKYDRVVTSGGMIGTIVEVKDDEVVIKVDESTNTKVHFSKSAVQSVLKRGSSSTGDSLEPAETAA